MIEILELKKCYIMTLIKNLADAERQLKILDQQLSNVSSLLRVLSTIRITRDGCCVRPQFKPWGFGLRLIKVCCEDDDKYFGINCMTGVIRICSATFKWCGLEGIYKGVVESPICCASAVLIHEAAHSAGIAVLHEGLGLPYGPQNQACYYAAKILSCCGCPYSSIRRVSHDALRYEI